MTWVLVRPKTMVGLVVNGKLYSLEMGSAEDEPLIYLFAHRAPLVDLSLFGRNSIVEAGR